MFKHWCDIPATLPIRNKEVYLSPGDYEAFTNIVEITGPCPSVEDTSFANLVDLQRHYTLLLVFVAHPKIPESARLPFSLMEQLPIELKNLEIPWNNIVFYNSINVGGMTYTEGHLVLRLPDK
jgi:hypothetical protein